MMTAERRRLKSRSWHVVPAAVLGSVVCVYSIVPALGQEKQWAIYVMRTDGSQLRQLVQVDGCTDHSSPRWSHDGKHVAFDANSGGRSASAVYVVGADGSGLRKLGEHSEPDWSPDGEWIVFASSRDPI